MKIEECIKNKGRNVLYDDGFKKVRAKIVAIIKEQSYLNCRVGISYKNRRGELINIFTQPIKLSNKEIKMKSGSKLALEKIEIKKQCDELLNVVKYSLEVVESLPCECDSYNGFTCGKHEWERKLRLAIKNSERMINSGGSK